MDSFGNIIISFEKVNYLKHFVTFLKINHLNITHPKRKYTFYTSNECFISEQMLQHFILKFREMNPDAKLNIHLVFILFQDQSLQLSFINLNELTLHIFKISERKMCIVHFERYCLNALFEFFKFLSILKIQTF